MQLLFPIGLLAISSLIVPILIHLWNVKRGRTLKIGSISLLGESSTLQSKSLKIKDWLLFLVRCLLLLILTIILCSPYILNESRPRKEKGWIMISAALLKEVYQENKQTIDSLLIIGYKVHNFGYGFEEMTLEDTSRSFALDTPKLSSLSLLKQLSSSMPKKFPVVLYAEKKLQDINQSLPVMDINLTWKDINHDGSTKKKGLKFGERIYNATLNPAYTKFDLLNSSLDSSNVQIAIFQQSNSVDAKYLIAAIQSIASYRGLKIVVKSITDPKQLNYANIVFWLSSKDLSDQVLNTFKQNAKVFEYAKGKSVDLNSLLSLNTGGAATNNPKLYRRIIATKYTGDVIWLDFQGTPILTQQKKRGRVMYKLYTRFNQNWTSLVWQDQFVRALVPIISPENAEYEDFGYLNVSNDQRLLNNNLPINKNYNVSTPKIQIMTKESLNHVFWIIGFLLFVLERILALRKGRRVINE